MGARSQNAGRLYQLVREFTLRTPDFAEAIRYQTKPDERGDLTLVSQRVYGDRDQALIIQAAAGLQSAESELFEQRLVLPTANQLQSLKAAAMAIGVVPAIRIPQGNTLLDVIASQGGGGGGPAPACPLLLSPENGFTTNDGGDIVFEWESNDSASYELHITHDGSPIYTENTGTFTVVQVGLGTLTLAGQYRWWVDTPGSNCAGSFRTFTLEPFYRAGLIPGLNVVTPTTYRIGFGVSWFPALEEDYPGTISITIDGDPFGFPVNYTATTSSSGFGTSRNFSRTGADQVVRFTLDGAPPGRTISAPGYVEFTIPAMDP